MAIGPGPRAGAERPPLPHASRTNKTLRSGLCEGRERRVRDLAVALGGLLVLVFCERRAVPRPIAALTCAHLRLTRRRPLQVRTWSAPPFLATLHPAGPCLAWSPAHAAELVREPRLSALYTAYSVPAPRHTHARARTHTHTHTHTLTPVLAPVCSGQILTQRRRSAPSPLSPPSPRLRGRSSSEALAVGVEGGVGDLGASGTTPDVTFPPTCLGEGVGRSRGQRLPGGG